MNKYGRHTVYIHTKYIMYIHTYTLYIILYIYYIICTLSLSLPPLPGLACSAPEDPGAADAAAAAHGAAAGRAGASARGGVVFVIHVLPIPMR